MRMSFAKWPKLPNHRWPELPYWSNPLSTYVPSETSACRQSEDLIRANRSEHVKLLGCIHACHVRSICLGKLHREGTHRPTRAVDQDRLSGLDPSLIAHVLDRERSRRGNGRSLLERETGRLQLEHGLRHGREFRESATVPPQVGEEALTEDLISGPETGDVRANKLDHSGHVRTRDSVLRCPHAGSHDTENVGHAPHGVPDIRMDRCRVHPHQYLVGRGGRSVDLSEREDIGRTVAVLDDRLHS